MLWAGTGGTHFPQTGSGYATETRASNQVTAIDLIRCVSLCTDPPSAPERGAVFISRGACLGTTLAGKISIHSCACRRGKCRRSSFLRQAQTAFLICLFSKIPPGPGRTNKITILCGQTAIHQRRPCGSFKTRCAVVWCRWRYGKWRGCMCSLACIVHMASNCTCLKSMQICLFFFYRPTGYTSPDLHRIIEHTHTYSQPSAQPSSSRNYLRRIRSMYWLSLIHI